MTASQSQRESRIVVVVGVDMSSLSEDLLTRTRALIRPDDEVEIHVVHVVRPEAPLLRLARPRDEKDAGVVHEVERSQWVVEHLCESLGQSSPRIRVIKHTPVGNPADELARIAADVGADILLVEAHEPREHGAAHLFHRSTVEHIASSAPCTVLTIRKARGAPEQRSTN